MSDNNQNTNFSAKLSEMDRIFIPKDLDSTVSLEDLADYQHYNVKFWRTVPENFRLVKVNRITQKIRVVDGYGLKLTWPLLTKTILVPAEIIDGKKEYKNEKFTSQDGVELSIDLTIVMNITDPVKYKRTGTTQLKQLDSVVRELLRIYVAHKDFDKLMKEECNLNKFDENNAFMAFEQEFGIRIKRVIIEKVQLPEGLQKIYNDAAEEKERRKAQSVRLKAEQEKAEADARVMGILADAEAEKIRKIEETKMDVYIKRMNQFIETLQAKGVPAAEIAEQLKLEIASKNGNAVFMSGNNSGINNNLASSVYAGNIASQNRQETKRKTNPNTNAVYTNSERLVEQMTMLEILLGPLPEVYENLRVALSTPGNHKKESVDKLTEEKYQELVRALHSQLNNKTRTEENPSRGPRR